MPSVWEWAQWPQQTLEKKANFFPKMGQNYVVSRTNWMTADNVYNCPNHCTPHSRNPVQSSQRGCQVPTISFKTENNKTAKKRHCVKTICELLKEAVADARDQPFHTSHIDWWNMLDLESRCMKRCCPTQMINGDDNMYTCIMALASDCTEITLASVL